MNLKRKKESPSHHNEVAQVSHSSLSDIQSKNARLCDEKGNRLLSDQDPPGSSDHRLCALTDLIHHCSHTELLHIHQTIEPLLKRDFIRHLPRELSLYIFSFLSVRDLLNCAKVSIRWKQISTDQVLWYDLCKQGDIIGQLVQKSPFTGIDNHPSHDVFNSDVDWKTTYRQSLETQCNWMHGTPHPPLIVPAHHNHVITCLEVYNNWSITGSDDSSICVWDLRTGQLLISLFGHVGGVWSLTVLPPIRGSTTPLLVSGSCDRTARVWSLDGSRWLCLATLFGHQSTVRCLAGQRDHHLVTHSNLQLVQKSSERIHHESEANPARLVVSGSRDTTLRLWDAVSGECLRLFQGHLGAIRCVKFVQNSIVSGSYDGTVRVWSIHNDTCLRVLDDHENRVYNLLFDGQTIISSSLDSTIRVWDVETGQLQHTFSGHRSLTSHMVSDQYNHLLVSSNADATIRVWNMKSGKCVYLLAGRHKHQSAVTCVQLSRKFIISSGDDGLVKLWDRHTGHFVRDLVRLDGAGRGGVIWRILATEHRLVCAAGSRNGMETSKLVVFNFDASTTVGPHVCRHHHPDVIGLPSISAPLPTLSQMVDGVTFVDHS